MNSSNSSTLSAKRGLSDRNMLLSPWTASASLGIGAVGIEIAMEMAPGLDPPDHLDAADLDHAVAARGAQARGFGVEDDFAHDAS